jgi:hypothetical protein
MELIHVTSPIYPSSSTSPTSSSPSITSITLLDGGRRVVLRHHDDTFTLIDFHSSSLSDSPSGRRQCRIKFRRIPSLSSDDLEVVPIASDDSMFAIRQGHILSLFLISEMSQPTLMSGTSMEAIQTLTLSLLTPFASFVTQQEPQPDLRSQDLTSKARLARYGELNQPSSISPSRTLIQRTRDGQLHLTLLGVIGTRHRCHPNGISLTTCDQQFVLAASLDITRAIQTSQEEILFHTLFSVGQVVCSSVSQEEEREGGEIGEGGGGILVTIDPQGTVRVMKTRQLHSQLKPLVEELTILSHQRLPTESDDLDLWESLKSIRETQFVAQHLFLHDKLTKSCIGMFQMRKIGTEPSAGAGAGGGSTKYALAISPTPSSSSLSSSVVTATASLRKDEQREEKGKLSIFISRKERMSSGGNGSRTNCSIYEVVI